MQAYRFTNKPMTLSWVVSLGSVHGDKRYARRHAARETARPASVRTWGIVDRVRHPSEYTPRNPMTLSHCEPRQQGILCRAPGRSSMVRKLRSEAGWAEPDWYSRTVTALRRFSYTLSKDTTRNRDVGLLLGLRDLS